MALSFDPERYLRASAKRALDAPSAYQTRRRWGSSVFETAAALVAVGSLPVGVASQILTEYEVTAELNWQDRPSRARPSANASGLIAGSRQTLGTPVVLALQQEITYAWGALEIHYVALGARETVVVLQVAAASPERRTGRWGRRQGIPLTRIVLKDDQGQEAAVDVSSTGRHRLIASTALSPATEWIDQGTTRLLTAPKRVHADGELERLPQADPAEQHLWQRISTYFRYSPLPGPLPLVDVSIQTLVAAHALTPDSSVISLVRRVAKCFCDPGAGAGELPPRWRSLLHGWANRIGPTGAAGVGALCPPVEGTAISMEGLVSSEESFDVYVRASPAWQLVDAPFDGLEPEAPLAWWAEDDCGNSYLGSVTDGTFVDSQNVSDGAIRFWPALDRRAGQIRILPTGRTERAIVAVPLPAWR